MSLIEIKAGTKAVAQEVQNNFKYLESEIARVDTKVEGVQGSIASQTGAVKTDLIKPIGENKTAIKGVEGRVETLEKYKDKIAVYTVYRHIGDDSWYTVYSDGWCEQGGKVGTASNTYYTVEFGQKFINTNIYISVSISLGTQEDSDKEGVDFGPQISNVTTESFRVSLPKNRQNSTWEAKGQINLEEFLKGLNKETGGQ